MKPFLAVTAWVTFAISLVACGCSSYSQAEQTVAQAVPTNDKEILVSDDLFEGLELNDAGKVELTPEQWQARLTANQFYVARKHGTEPSHNNEYWDNKDEGTYRCVACGQHLFSSDTKYKSGTGWPSFWQPLSDEAVGTSVDRKFFMTRTEVHCSRCESHLGHVFEDGPRPTGLRYCMNSAAMLFEPTNNAKADNGQVSE